MKMPMIIHDLQDSQMFALAQAAGRAGIPVKGLASSDMPWIRQSRYVKSLDIVPSLGDVPESVYALNLKNTGKSGVWLPCVDDIAMFTASFKSFLCSRGLSFLIADAGSMEQADIAALHGCYGALHIPPTHWWTWDRLCDAMDTLDYPIILKSVRGHFRVFKSAAELHLFVTEAGEEVSHFKQRTQQYIPGGVQCMATAMLLFDKDSRPVRGFTGRRLRVTETAFGPFGETTAARAEWIPELYEGACELLSAMKWQGFAEVECKQDADGRWYVLEINPRLSGWACLAEADGAGFLQAYYQICAHETCLDEACLQRSRAEYVRMVAAGFHAPDWLAASDLSTGKWSRIRRLICELWRVVRAWPQVLPGAMDWRDRKASWEIFKYTLRKAGWLRD